MGTNYYVKTNECECCKRHDLKHIGKASYGWSFGFHGIKEEGLVSWDAWKKYLHGKHIVNEYDDEVDYNWFVDYVEYEKSPEYVNSSGKRNASHYDYLKESIWSSRSNEDWVDDAGYTFSLGEFS